MMTPRVVKCATACSNDTVMQRYVFVRNFNILIILVRAVVGRVSSVGIRTRYGLGGPEFEPKWGKVFSLHPSI